MVERGGHVVVFPFPASGHIAPFVPFARCIASHGVAITFLYPKHEYARVRELESFDARENVELVAFDVPLAGGLSFSSFDTLKYFMYDNVAQFDAIVAQLMDRPRTIQYPAPCDAGPPVCIVSDMFLGFTQATAEKLNIKRYCLFASPVHFLSLMFHLPKFNGEGRIPTTSLDQQEFHIPNFPPIPPGDLPPSQYEHNGQPGSHLFLLNEVHQLLKSAGVLVNSVAELELPAMEGLQQIADDLKLPKILTVGPLVAGIGEGKTTYRQKMQEAVPKDSCFDWLNKQPDCSVLYICFGTVAMLSPEQIHEMAMALERSQERFFWVLRIADRGSQVEFPEGFLERTKSRGLVWLDWAPQAHILAHRAIKGFVSHCGWNSTIESIAVGVPMIAWPYQAEQMMNATLLDQVLGVAIRINKIGGWYGDLISAERFENAIQTLMVEPAGDRMREKAVQVSEVIDKAVRPGGSSRSNLETFVQDVRTLATTTTTKVK